MADFANACSFLLLIFFLGCNVAKIATLVELQRVQEIISNEQESDFHVPSVMLSATLFSCVIVTLVASFAMLLVQLAVERERAARDARAAKARRLRYIQNSAEVLVPALPHRDGFHLFLSHTWGTGQDQSSGAASEQGAFLCCLLP